MASSGTGPPMAAAVTIPLACGVLVGGMAAPDGWIAMVVAGAVAVLALPAWIARSWSGSWRTIAAAGAAGLGGGALAAALAAWPLAADHLARHVVPGSAAVDGVIVASERAGDRLALVVQTERLRARNRERLVSGLLGVTIAHARQDWGPGRRVHLVGRLRRPRNFGNPGEYDFVAALARRGIRVRMFLWDESSITAAGADLRTSTKIGRAHV